MQKNIHSYTGHLINLLVISGLVFFALGLVGTICKINCDFALPATLLGFVVLVIGASLAPLNQV
ncbi:hypothetical protein KC851_02645 [Candidatus Kaiserbacteria bacterium]|nr:hypothetical protein [Candidatus Kaiserbacteria bacterium]